MVLLKKHFRSATCLIAVAMAAPSPAVDVLTFHNDGARTGQNLAEVILTTSNVNPNTFGKLFTISVDGKVDAQPLYVSAQVMPDGKPHNLLIVATENDTIYAHDADSGAVLWQVSLLKSGEIASDNRGCGQVVPTIGVTGTPVIDLNKGPNGTIYVVAMSKNQSGLYFQRLHALNLKTGVEEFGGPVDIQASYPGTGDNSAGGSVIFDPKQYKARPGLLIINDTVYIGWSSHCDIHPYTAWLMGYDENSLVQVSVLNLTPNGQGGSIWQAGAGPATDLQGNILFLMANGSFDTTVTPEGLPVGGDYGNAFMKVTPLTRGLAVTDFFTMHNTVSESGADEDLGSGGAMVLPDMVDSIGATRHLAVGAGKDGIIYIVDRDHMGKFNPSTDQNYESPAVLPGGVFSSPAYFNGSLYYGAAGAAIQAFSFSAAKLAGTPVSQSSHAFPFPGTTPSISANGASNGILWSAENTSTAVLHAYNASNLGQELYNSNTALNSRDHFGSGNKFITPTIANGKVYVGTTNGVGVFGVFPGNVTPAITSATTASAIVGIPFRYQIAAANGPTTFGTTALPAGLVFNAASGTIAGIPSSSGIASVTISASNSAGSGSAILSIMIASKPTSGDPSGLGKLGLVWTNDLTRQAVWWYMSGPGGNNENSWDWISQFGVPGWRISAIADFDGDGYADLFWINDSTRQSIVWYMGGPGGNIERSWEWISQAGVPGWSLVGAADFDRDGIPDLVWQNDSTRQVVVWYMSGAGTNGAHTWAWLSQNGVPGWTIKAIGDFNHDSAPDVIWQSDSARQYIVWYMAQNGTAELSWEWVSQSGVPGWSVAGAGDFNGDGNIDLLLVNDSTRQTIFWYLSAPGTIAQHTWDWVSQYGVPGWQPIVSH
jgi:hypothetical protein